MEQTLVNQFFPSVKNGFANQPAKRRKVSDSLNMEEMVSVKQLKQRAPRTNKTLTTVKTRTSRTRKATETSLSQLFTAKPVTLSSEPTSVKDQHGELKRKIPQKKSAQPPASNVVEKGTSGEAELHQNAKDDDSINNRGSLKVNPWISEQAKLVLQQSGRGRAAVEASRGKGLANSKNLKPSDLLNPNSEAKADVVNKGNVREECAKKFQESIRREPKGRGRLREKYAHLLLEKGKQSSTSISSEKPAPIEESSKSKRVPAHQKYKHLVAVDKPAVAFTLPQKYRDLLEMFRCVDSVLFLLQRRKETCTFERLKKSVQTMLGRKFTEKNLAQMKTVYPKGFTLRQEKNLRDLNGMPAGQQLTIDANFEELFGSKERKEAISQTVLITRRNLFESSLLDITKKFHQKFLRKLNLKIADSDLHRWHPNFKLDEVPDVPEATLPQVAAIKVCTSAKDMLEKTNLIPQVEQALAKVAESKDCKGKLPAATTTTTEPKLASTNSNKNLKGVSDAILERIKQKELKNAELAMLRNPEQEKRLEMMDRFPECVRILKTYFTTERKAAIAMEDCVRKLSESFGSISSTAKIEEHVRLLNELVPEWLVIVNVRKCPYLKLSKKADVNIVLNKLASIKEDARKR
eukprot:gene19079-20994_t